MSKNTYATVMGGNSDSNIRFTDLRYLLFSWSEEDQSYIVAVPELPGCMADGKTPEEAVANAEVIIQEWIACALGDGEPVPEPSLFGSARSSLV